jgi:hypothetical protein
MEGEPAQDLYLAMFINNLSGFLVALNAIPANLRRIDIGKA